MKNIAISTAAFCLWDIGPKRKIQICKDLGFNHIVIAFSTLKMIKQFLSLPELCQQISKFQSVSIHAPWRGVTYKENRIAKETIDCLEKITAKVNVTAIIFHFDCISDFDWLKNCNFKYYIKNPNRYSWEIFSSAIEKHSFEYVLDINRATRFENYIDKYLKNHKDSLKAIYVSGYVDDLGRTPITESGQQFLLNKLKTIEAPIVIEGLFSPGDFQGIRDELETIMHQSC